MQCGLNISTRIPRVLIMKDELCRVILWQITSHTKVNTHNERTVRGRATSITHASTCVPLASHASRDDRCVGSRSFHRHTPVGRGQVYPVNPPTRVGVSSAQSSTLASPNPSTGTDSTSLSPLSRRSSEPSRAAAARGACLTLVAAAAPRAWG